MTRLPAIQHDKIQAFPSAGTQRVIVFYLAGQAYAVPLADVQEIVPMALLSQPPTLPPVLAGFLDLGGIAVPVVRLARLLGLPEQPPGLYTPMLILRTADTLVAWLVDAVSGIMSVDDQAVVPIGESYCFNDCAKGLVTSGGSHVILLAFERILLAQELRRIAELAAIEQARLTELCESRP